MIINMLGTFVFIIESIVVVYSFLYFSWIQFSLYIGFLYFLHVILPSFFGFKYVSGSDTVWFSDTPNNLRYIQGALVIDRINRDEAKKIVTGKGIGTQEKFKYRSAKILGRMYWKIEENYDPEKHIVYYEKPISTIEELYAYKEDLFIKRIPDEKAQWEMHLIELFEKDKSVIIFKSHHSLCDGLALISLIVSNSDKREVTEKDNYINFNRKSLSMQILYYLKAIIMFPYILISMSKNKEPNTPIHGGALSGHKSVAATPDIPLKKLKAFCVKENISINTYLLSIVGAAIQKFLQSKNSFQKEITVVVPYSMRVLPKDNTFLELINDISFLVFPIPVNISDETKRFRVFHEICESMKYSAVPFANSMSQKIIGTLCINSVAAYIFNDCASNSSFNFTNIPGPKNEISFSGRKLHKIFFASPCSGTNALTISSLSYNDNMTIGITCDEGVVGKATDLMKYILKELEILN